MPPSSAPRWRSAPPDAIVWREWDDEVVVRNERSGSTHLLAPLGGTVLRILLQAEGPLAVADVVERLAERWPNEFGPRGDTSSVGPDLSGYHERRPNEFGPTGDASSVGPDLSGRHDRWPNEFGPTGDASSVGPDLSGPTLEAAVEAALSEFRRLGLAQPVER